MNGLKPSLVFLAAFSLACTPDQAQRQQDAATLPAQSPAERGRYLVETTGCHDCHTPKVFTAQGPALDTSRLLSGHPSAEVIPAVPRGLIGPQGWGAITTNGLTGWYGPWGTSFAANLTPDSTGLGTWSDSVFMISMRTGRHLGNGRQILPPMPWWQLARMTDDDLRAIFAYLQSVPSIRNRVPAPRPPA